MEALEAVEALRGSVASGELAAGLRQRDARPHRHPIAVCTALPSKPSRGTGRRRMGPHATRVEEKGQSWGGVFRRRSASEAFTHA